MTRETTTSQATPGTAQRESISRMIAGLPLLDPASAMLVRSVTGIDPLALGDRIGQGLRVAEGQDGGEAWVSIVALVADDEARALYGDAFAVRLPVSSARHADRGCAAALAVLSIRTADGRGEGLIAA